MKILTKQYIRKHIEDNKIDITNRFELIFSYDKITSIEEGAFDGLNNLKGLFLNDNQITSIKKGVFDGLHNLKWLNLSSNQISSIEEGAFDGLNNLTELFLNDNQITSIKKGVFDGLHNLKGLFLNDNQITSIKKGVFDGLHNLKGLYLPCNQISSIEEGAFDGLNNLKWLNLSSNQITSIKNKYYESREKILELINDLKNNNRSQIIIEAEALKKGETYDTINHSIPLEKSSKVFEEIGKIRQNRPALHGSARDNFKKIAALWSAYLDTEVTIQDVGFMMSMLKAARHKNGDKNNMDNFFDGANYIALAGEGMWDSLFNPI